MNFKKSNKLFKCFKIGLIFSCPSSCRPTLVTDSLTYSLFCHCVGFKAFQPSGLPDQTEILQNWWKSWRNMTWPTKTNAKTKTMTMTNFFETFDLWDIWSEWWENMTWPTKRQRRRQRQIQRQWQWQIHLKKTFKEQSLRLLAFETFDQSNEKTWPDQQKDNNKDENKYNDDDKYIKRTPPMRDFWRHFENTLGWKSKRSSESDQ